MKKINKIHVMLLGISLLFANANAKASDHQEIFADEDNQTTVEKSSLSKYIPFAAISTVLLIVGGRFAWKHFSDSNLNGSNSNDPTPNSSNPNDSSPNKQSSHNQQTITHQDAQSSPQEVNPVLNRSSDEQPKTAGVIQREAGQKQPLLQHQGDVDKEGAGKKASNPSGITPHQQTITHQDAQSFLEDVLEITREATSCKTVSEEVEKYLQECLNFFKNATNRENIEKALNKWESSDEIDDCLTKFIQNIITKDPSFKPLAKKYPAIFTELQEGRIPTILARYDHDNPRSQGHEWTCGCCHLSSPTLKDFLIQRIRIGLTEGQKFIQGEEEDSEEEDGDEE